VQIREIERKCGNLQLELFSRISFFSIHFSQLNKKPIKIKVNMKSTEASGFFKCQDGRTIEIRDVWASNLEEEMANIRDVIEKFPYVAMVVHLH
jgi:hypothetical protein